MLKHRFVVPPLVPLSTSTGIIFDVAAEGFGVLWSEHVCECRGGRLVAEDQRAALVPHRCNGATVGTAHAQTFNLLPIAFLSIVSAFFFYMPNLFTFTFTGRTDSTGNIISRYKHVDDFTLRL